MGLVARAFLAARATLRKVRFLSWTTGKNEAAPADHASSPTVPWGELRWARKHDAACWNLPAPPRDQSSSALFSSPANTLITASVRVLSLIDKAASFSGGEISDTLICLGRDSRALPRTWLRQPIEKAAHWHIQTAGDLIEHGRADAVLATLKFLDLLVKASSRYSPGSAVSCAGRYTETDEGWEEAEDLMLELPILYQPRTT
ncbi:hypothetical protein GGI64_004149 [Rhizobium leguminosarum]|uniref:Uncharacterized protein n=1 Tax=Rhizobium leguminosarum TaxID=384 RepID=A0A7Z0E114_RHILE|nr:hypothetical protein [Rhizobium leguminosarum]NYJ13068.1 hypothetical protein [Rhizobium leguminosarum]